MLNLKNVSVKTKIFIFVGIFQVLALIIAILGTYGLSSMETQFFRVSNVLNNFQSDLTQFRYNINKRRNLIYKAVSANTKQDFTTQFALAKKAEEDMLFSFKKMKEFIKEGHFRSDANKEELNKVMEKIDLVFSNYNERTAAIERDIQESFLPATTFYRKQDLRARVDKNLYMGIRSDVEILEDSDAIDKAINVALKDIRSSITLTSSSVKTVLWTGFVLCMVVAFAVAYMMLRRIAFPIEAAADMANKFAEGDLTVSINNDASDEIGYLVRSLNKAAQTISKLIKNIGETADHLASSAEQLSATSRNLADGATNQASSLEQTASAITEISESISYVSQSAKDQEKEVLETNKYMKELSKSIIEISQTVKTLNDGSQAVLSESKDGQIKVDESVTRMGAIEESSEQISDIIVVINDIFTQTNLLSLNAAIEAARAGESGRGFAVVAEEISKLAARSQKATNEIDELIADSISKVNDGKAITGQIVESLNNILNKSKEAASLSDNIAGQTKLQSQSNEKVMGSIKTLSQMAESISRATAEMDLSAKEIANAIEQVNSVAQNTASSSEEMAASTSELAAQSEKLSQLIDAFKIN
jgi:methyl-accepting chemotaxis protein